MNPLDSYETMSVSMQLIWAPGTPYKEGKGRTGFAQLALSEKEDISSLSIEKEQIEQSPLLIRAVTPE